MKLLPGALVSEVDGEYVAVTLGKAGKKFNGMIRMNGTAAFLVQRLQTEQTEESLTDALRENYEVSAEEARANVRSVVEKLHAAGLLEE